MREQTLKRENKLQLRDKLVVRVGDKREFG
jgi:hypothetical protein